MIDAILAALGLKKAVVVGGFIGSTLSLKFLPSMNIWQGVSTLIGGWAIASHLTPLIMSLIDVNEKHEGGFGFLVGVMGMAVIGNILKAMPEWLRAARSKFFGSTGESTGEDK